ncbi:MAG TPA: imidazole glycerol phosphate synthase subunit HisH [Dongiaceae bacterium]
MASVAVVDSGGANITSVLFALERLGAPAKLTANPAEIEAASHVLLPGVGAAGPGMAKLQQKDLIPCLRGLRQPVMGVCLGMQLMFERSTEGDVECLGLLKGEVRRFKDGPDLTVPHMGWNDVTPQRAGDPLLAGLAPGQQAYYVHSFFAPVTEDTVAICDYGVPFAAMVHRGNLYGCQFHPERSSAVGKQVLENFLAVA